MIDLDFDPSIAFAFIWVPLQILAIDLLLSADNALVIALACRGLPLEEMRRATLLGTLGAIILRIAMGSVALVLMRTPYLRLIAAALLLYIAVNLTLEEGIGEAQETAQSEPLTTEETLRRHRAGLLKAVWTILVADATMSLDNVVAVAAIAQDNMLFLGLGLAMSIPMLIWGSTLIRQFLEENSFLILLSGAFLGWIAGGIAVTDPTIAPSIEADAPALIYALPLACAIFVAWQSLILASRSDTSGGKHAD